MNTLTGAGRKGGLFEKTVCFDLFFTVGKIFGCRKKTQSFLIIGKKQFFASQSSATGANCLSAMIEEEAPNRM